MGDTNWPVIDQKMYLIFFVTLLQNDFAADNTNQHVYLYSI